MKLAYEGGGEFWDLIETWTLNARGDRLTMDDGEGAAVIVWIRCG